MTSRRYDGPDVVEAGSLWRTMIGEVMLVVGRNDTAQHAYDAFIYSQTREVLCWTCYPEMFTSGVWLNIG